MITDFDNEIRLKVLKLFHDEPELIQREMNQKMGISFGKINFCISTLSQQVMIKMEIISLAEQIKAIDPGLYDDEVLKKLSWALL
jgi:predicted transcriptional regulator